MAIEYRPRKLPKTREYPGYQFYAILAYANQSADACFRRAALTVTDWLKERMEHSGTIPPEIRTLPDRSGFAEIDSAGLRSFRISAGFAADVTSLPERGIWTLRLKEPDSDTQKRKALPGRLFTTNVSLHVMDDARVELAVRIDVTDPDGAAEIDYAFRPKFIRYLFQTAGLTLTQASSLPYEQAVPVGSEEDFRALRELLDNASRLMPAVLLTQSVRLPAFPSDPMALLNDAPRVRMFPETPPVCPPLSTRPETYYPFPPDRFASHAFGYGYTFAVTEDLHALLAKKLRGDYTPGDILVIAPKRFGGNVRTFGMTDADAPDRAQAYVHAYSKNRNYSFGDTIFEYDARGIAQEEQIERILRSDKLRDGEKISRLNGIIRELQRENEDKIRKIDELKQQNLSEFRRGEESAREEHLSLMERNEQLEKEIHALQVNNERLEAENADARGIREAVRAFRSMETMPQTNEDVVNYFSTAFGDRVAFTDKGRKTACKCDIRPAALWYYLFHMANELFGLYTSNIPDIETWFMNNTGIEVALSEGSQTRNDSRLMRLREDEYQGKTIFTEPHVKLNDQRAGAANRRIYYCYDRELDRIIIGHVGEHLSTFGSLFVR